MCVFSTTLVILYLKEEILLDFLRSIHSDVSIDVSLKGREVRMCIFSL